MASYFNMNIPKHPSVCHLDDKIVPSKEKQFAITSTRSPWYMYG